MVPPQLLDSKPKVGVPARRPLMCLSVCHAFIRILIGHKSRQVNENEVKENDKEEKDEKEEHDKRLRTAPLYMMTGDCMVAEQQRGRLLCARTLPSQVFQSERAQDAYKVRAARYREPFGTF